MKPALVLGLLATAITSSLLMSQRGGPPEEKFPAGTIDPWDEKALAADATLRRPVVIYTRKNAPATPRLNRLPSKSSVSQYGITWTFEKPARVG